MFPGPPRPTLFPYTTLFRSVVAHPRAVDLAAGDGAVGADGHVDDDGQAVFRGVQRREIGGQALGDRKSTRLNSSHTVISYAVFCLKKKKRKKTCHATYLRHL